MTMLVMPIIMMTTTTMIILCFCLRTDRRGVPPSATGTAATGTTGVTALMASPAAPVRPTATVKVTVYANQAGHTLC